MIIIEKKSITSLKKLTKKRWKFKKTKALLKKFKIVKIPATQITVFCKFCVFAIWFSCLNLLKAEKLEKSFEQNWKTFFISGFFLYAHLDLRFRLFHELATASAVFALAIIFFVKFLWAVLGFLCLS